MARARVKVPSSLKVKVVRQMDKLVKDPLLLNEIKKFSVDRIVSMSRLEQSMQGTKRSRKLPNLSKSYMAQRRGEVHFRKINGRTVPFDGPDPSLETDPEFFNKNAKKSNLTLSGQFLKSIQGRVARSKLFRGTVIIAATGRRKDGKKNTQIYSWLTKLNKRYQIFAMNESGQKQIRKITVRFLRRKLRNKIRVK